MWHIWALDKRHSTHPVLQKKRCRTLSLFHFRKPSGPKPLPPNQQDGNGIQSVRSSKRTWDAIFLDRNINMKSLKPWATRRLRKTAKHCEEPRSLLLIPSCDNNTQLRSEPAAGNRSFFQGAQRTAWISLISQLSRKDMHRDYHQGIQTELDLISIAIKIPKLQPLVNNSTESAHPAALQEWNLITVQKAWGNNTLQTSCLNQSW